MNGLILMSVRGVLFRCITVDAEYVGKGKIQNELEKSRLDSP